VLPHAVAIFRRRCSGKQDPGATGNRACGAAYRPGSSATRCPPSWPAWWRSAPGVGGNPYRQTVFGGGHPRRPRARTRQHGDKILYAHFPHASANPTKSSTSQDNPTWRRPGGPAVLGRASSRPASLFTAVRTMNRNGATTHAGQDHRPEDGSGRRHAADGCPAPEARTSRAIGYQIATAQPAPYISPTATRCSFLTAAQGPPRDPSTTAAMKPSRGRAGRRGPRWRAVGEEDYSVAAVNKAIYDISTSPNNATSPT